MFQIFSLSLLFGALVSSLMYIFFYFKKTFLNKNLNQLQGLCFKYFLYVYDIGLKLGGSSFEFYV